MAMKECSVFPKPQHNWNLSIRLFSVICRTPIGGGGGSYHSSEVQSVYSTAPADWANRYIILPKNSITKSLKNKPTKSKVFIYLKWLHQSLVLKILILRQSIKCLLEWHSKIYIYILLILFAFIYLGSSVESTEKDIDTRLTKAWTAINRLSIIWKSDLTDKMKRSFFQAAVTSILLYGCTTWSLTKRLEKKLDGNYTRMLRAILNKSWRQHPKRHQLYGHLPPITKTIQVRRTRHAGHCWRSRDELISDVLLWTTTDGRAKAGRPARTYIQQLCEDTGCCPEDLPGAMNDREEWRERVRDIRATSVTWWWWWWYS